MADAYPDVTLIRNGASPVGAQRAADGVLNGDFTEAKRLSKVLEGKRARQLAAAPKPAAGPAKPASGIGKAPKVKEDAKGKPDGKAEEERVKAALEAKDRELAKLRDGIAKTRAAIAQLKASGARDAPISKLEALLASMTARYQELTGSSAAKNKPAVKPPPAPSPEGGTVTHADGSRTVLTYRQDASGKKVPVTTEYDRSGRVVRQTTVDDKGKTVPVR